MTRFNYKSVWILFLILLSGSVILFASLAGSTEDTCLAFMGTRGDVKWGSTYVYQQFSDRELTIKSGDRLEYDLYIDPDAPNSKCGINIIFENRKHLQSVESLKDQNGLGTNWSVELTPAVGQWYHRIFNLDPIIGWKTKVWTLVISGTNPGAYIKFYDNIIISHADGTRTVIYENGSPSMNMSYRIREFQKLVVLQPILRTRIAESKPLSFLMAPLIQRQKITNELTALKNQLNWAKEMSRLSGRDTPSAQKLIQQNIDSLSTAMNQTALSDEEVNRICNQATEVLKTTLLPFSRDFTGHLVSHAHIDAQWLWEWPETLEELKNTFLQALVFMDEYPGFTFTQSSSMFYQATEYQWPEIFRKIRDRVKSGQWELVGGRITEADNNLISPEAQVREFLYGQRYFRERFDGKQALVAWEPDTFGHNAQMPQIVKQSGCLYYYFCRAGKDIPLFWWEGLDGTRILAFQEVNSWYNSDLSQAQFDEMTDFYKRVGSRDILWVYGVGNHGGGATREYLDTALGWMQKPYLPQAQFSTATRFFQTLEQKYDLSRIPVIKGELNFVFEGCYTTHGDIKRMNNEAQALAESAEAVSAIAGRYGFPYPGTQIRQMWEDICWNHHHDTIDGSAVHAPYERSREVYTGVLSHGRLIASDALAHLAMLVKAPQADMMVFNPTGAARDALVSCVVPSRINLDRAGVKTGERTSAIQATDPDTRSGFFIARQIPPYGYRIYTIVEEEAPRKPGVQISPDGMILENAKLRVTLDPTSGTIVSIFNKQLNYEFVPPGGSANRLEIYWEKVDPMAAWVIGPVDHKEILGRPVSIRTLEKGAERVLVEIVYPFQESRLTQKISLYSDADYVDIEFTGDWKETGFKHPTLAPFLKVAMDLNIPYPVARFEIPFGDVSRPVDGKEVPALKWVDVSNDRFGISLINDSKHGHSITTDTLRLSLIRTPNYPDATSDNYIQTVHYRLYPHAGDAIAAETAAQAFAFVHPVLTTLTTGRGRDLLPQEFSFVSVSDPNVMITAVKRAEEDDDLIVRLYESGGRSVRSFVRTAFSGRKARPVNFIEDPCAGDILFESGGLSLGFRPYEIKTVKLDLAPEPDVRMTGTRGPGSLRPF